MPFERREVLFYLSEIGPALIAAGRPLVGKIPASGDVQILDALHSRDFHRTFHDVQARFRDLHNARGQIEGVMLRASISGLLKREQTIGFIVSDESLGEILLQACKDYKISLPRAARKKVVAQDLTIGFELIFDTAGLSLELESF